MVRKILGTNKFIVYMYNGKHVRQTRPAESKFFIGKQKGVIISFDEDGKSKGKPKAFNDYGQMLTFINKIVNNQLRKNLRSQK